MKFQGFVGPTYNLKSVNVDAQRCVNMFPEIVESGTGKGGDIAYLAPTPGLEKILSVGNGPIRCVHVDSAGVILVVSGNQLFKISYTNGSWGSSLIYSSANSYFKTTTGRVYASSMHLYNDLTNTTVFTDGVVNYVYVRDDVGLEIFVDYPNYGYAALDGASHVILLDGYLVYSQTNANQFYVSDINSLAVNPLSFASSEGDPDNIVSIISNNRDLWIFNEKTTEVFSNTGNADFPFERVAGGFIEKGCAAKHSVAKIDGFVFWLGRDQSGQGIVYAARGMVPERISTHAVEAAMKRYADISTATAYTYQSGGHSFYVLNFTEGTWVYDFSTKLWHERAYTNSGALERHRADNHIFVESLGIHLVGDYANNKVYKLNDDYFSDEGAEITRLRAAPHVSNGLLRLFCNGFKLDIESGVGLNETSQGNDPQIMLDYSDDGGHTWSSELWTSMGKIGEYKKRIYWRRLGSFRDRVFRIKITDPVKVNILGAEIDLETGAN